MADAGKLQQIDSTDTDDGSPVSIPIPAMPVQTSPVPDTISILIPVPGSRNVNSTDSPDSGWTSPANTKTPISSPGSKNVNSLPSHITNHPWISQTAYETAV